MKKISLLVLLVGVIISGGIMTNVVKADFTTSWTHTPYNSNYGALNFTYPSNNSISFVLKNVFFKIDYTVRAMITTSGEILNSGDSVAIGSRISFAYSPDDFKSGRANNLTWGHTTEYRNQVETASLAFSPRNGYYNFGSPYAPGNPQCSLIDLDFPCDSTSCPARVSLYAYPVITSFINNDPIFDVSAAQASGVLTNCSVSGTTMTCTVAKEGNIAVNVNFKQIKIRVAGTHFETSGAGQVCKGEFFEQYPSGNWKEIDAPAQVVTVNLVVPAPVVPPPQCSDNIDNDGDGRIDFDGNGNAANRDLGCDDADDDNEVDPPQCRDTRDNDGDGKVDHPADIGCTDPDDDNEANLPQCSDNLDNDGDTKKDTLDPGCHSDGDASNATSYVATDDDETDVPACRDTRDNDGDGKVDHPADGGCSDPDDDTEDGPWQCSDGIDNDGDTFIDFGSAATNDPGCDSADDDNETNVVVIPAPTVKKLTAGNLTIDIAGTFEAQSAVVVGAGNQYRYQFDWDGDEVGPFGTPTGFVNAGDPGQDFMTWISPGDYKVKARTMDNTGRVSAWSTPLDVVVGTPPPACTEETTFWTGCSASCGPATKNQIRIAPDTNCLPVVTETQSCNLPACDSDIIEVPVGP